MNTITVSQLNTYIKALFDESAPLKNIYIVGEISNFHNHYSSGHLYFTLKDSKSQIKCIMFAGNASKLRFTPEDGMSVICRGRVNVYDRDGIYQLYCDDMQPDGIGALSIAFEQLKKKLFDEGLFDDEHKKPIPKYPMKIGVATSSTGAAVEDIKNITRRRFPLAKLYIAHTVVQGENAPKSIVESIKTLDSKGDIDVIILGRGGGSLEDLWAFNSPEVAYAIYDCNTPIISAVGHETDFSISDFVADLRAPTPSAAAELAVPDMQSELVNIETYYNNLIVSVSSRINNDFICLDRITSNPFFTNPLTYIKAKEEELDGLKESINSSFKSSIQSKSDFLANNINKLDALSPLSVLKRGYAALSIEGTVISSKTQLKDNDRIDIALYDGVVSAKISEIKEKENE